MSAPQALKGMRIQTGAEVESMIYANFSRETLKRSNNGRDTDPATRIVRFDSIKITIPVSQARTCARRGFVTHRACSTHWTKPRIPPFASTVAIKAPIRNVKTMTSAFPESPRTAIVPSIASAAPVTGFQPAMIVKPPQIPAASERKTCRV